MVSFEKELLINRPQQEVFDFLSDPANDARWQTGVISSEWTSEGPAGVGSTVRAVNRFLGRKMDSTLQVTEWDPPGRYGFKTISGPVPFQATIVLEGREEGTQLRMTGSAEVGGFFKLAEGLVGRQLQKQMSSDIDALKVLLERGEA